MISKAKYRPLDQPKAPPGKITGNKDAKPELTEEVDSWAELGAKLVKQVDAVIVKYGQDKRKFVNDHRGVFTYFVRLFC